MLLKKLAAIAATTVVAILPFSAQAAGLTVVNNTDYDSTSVINHGPCSTILGEIGITRAHSTNTVPESKVKFACLLNKHNCQADVYMTPNCKGPVVAKITFDVDAGIKNIEMKSADFKISGSGFAATLDQA